MFISLANVFLDQIKCMHFHAFAFGNLSRKVGFGKIKVTIYKTMSKRYLKSNKLKFVPTYK